MKINRALIFSVFFLIPSIYLTAATFYVWKDNPNPQAPYDSWENAAQSIQDAIDVSSDGDLILVTNGVYDVGGYAISNGLSNRVVINKPIIVKSLNGPSETLIVGGTPYDIKTGSGAIRCVWMTNGAVLSGFTLTNGYTSIGGVGNDNVRGGAVYGTSTNAILTNCVIIGNNGFEGGGVYSCSMFNSIIKGNSAVYGGGVHSSVLYNCVLTDNSAVWEGGGVHTSTLYNTVLTGNSAYTGGGANNSTLVNCTLTGNSANDTGGGVVSCNLTNCIVYYNSAQNGANHSDSVFNFSCTTPLPVGGVGNISDEPQLASSFHISATSPCIDKGDASSVYGVDIDGEVWSDQPSIGADQLIPGDATGSLSMRITASATRVLNGSTISFIANNDGKITLSVWDFGDGSFATNQPFITHKFTNNGTNIVRLTGYNDTYPDGVVAEVAIEVISQEARNHYVNVNSQNPVSPYSDWDTAATTIQDAIDAANDGDVIIVSDGVYNTGGLAVFGLMTNRVVINKPLTIKSLNGPSKTIISGCPSALGT
ncbi:MAG TPA: PKD domain-containing protein, partial [Verrucomicrobiota bacterium]|nr:PKD domain-containing protein [Verrucomicrobiota bacterium]